MSRRAVLLVGLVACAPEVARVPAPVVLGAPAPATSVPATTAPATTAPATTAPSASWDPLPGDPERGAVLFEAECASCHTGDGFRLTACRYEEYEPWQPGDLAGLSLDAMTLQVVFGGECMPPMSVPLDHANGLGAPPMFTREEVEDVVSYVADRFGRP